MLSDAQQQKRLLEEQIDRLSEQKLAVNQLYERELKSATDLHTFVSNLCETKCNETNSYKPTGDYEKDLQQFNAIKQTQMPEIRSFIARFDQVLQTAERMTSTDPSKASRKDDDSLTGMTISLEMKEEIWNGSDALPIIDDQTTIERRSLTGVNVRRCSSLLVYSDSDSKHDESMQDTNNDEMSMGNISSEQTNGANLRENLSFQISSKLRITIHPFILRCFSTCVLIHLSMNSIQDCSGRTLGKLLREWEHWSKHSPSISVSSGSMSVETAERLRSVCGTQYTCYSV